MFHVKLHSATGYHGYHGLLVIIFIIIIINIVLDQKEMAASTTMNEMQKALECSICLQELQDPKVLPCQHTFCKVCMDTILNFNNDGSATINCPLRCDGNTVIATDKTTNDLAAPYQLKHILDIMKRRK